MVCDHNGRGTCLFPQQSFFRNKIDFHNLHATFSLPLLDLIVQHYINNLNQKPSLESTTRSLSGRLGLLSQDYSLSNH